MTRRALIALLRPHHWVKNVLVFAPVVFAGALFSPSAMVASAIAFLAFCAAASAVYIFNDLRDIEEDRAHPKKQQRPLANGSVTVKEALTLLGVAFACALLFSLATSSLLHIIFLYIGLNIVYTLFLKHVAIVDSVFVSSFYVLRVVAGGVVAQVTLSPWIILATFFLALFLVVGKRRGEHAHPKRRVALDGYAKETLDGLLLGSALLSVATYSLWVILTHPTTLAVCSVMVVTAVVFRMLNHLYLHPEDAETPEKAVFKDKWIFIATILWGFLMLGLLYL